MSETPFVNLPPYWVNRAAFALRGELQQAFARDGIDVTPEEWAVQMVLHERAPITVGQLAVLTLRDRTTVTRVLENLERKGLAARTADAADRRRTLVQLSPAGTELFPRMLTHVQTLVRRSSRGIHPDAMAATVEVLQRIVANLAEEPEPIS